MSCTIQDANRILMRYVQKNITPPSLRICIDEQMKEKGLNYIVSVRNLRLK